MLWGPFKVKASRSDAFIIIIVTFGQVSQLLQKLQTDLHLSFHSFLKEFVAQPNDGVRRICYGDKGH